MRDLPGFLETRQALLEQKSGAKHNWISFALAHHLCGHHEVAVKVLESYQGEPALLCCRAALASPCDDACRRPAVLLRLLCCCWRGRLAVHRPR